MKSEQPVENVLRQDIVAGILRPSTKLRMEILKKRYKVGHSPIREALSKLIGEGLVSFQPNRGFAVAPLSFEDLYDIATARIAVECAALELSIRQGDDNWEAKVVGALHKYKNKAKVAFESDEKLGAWEKAHDDLHASIISACNSPRLLELQAKFQEQHKRYRRLIVLPDLPRNAHIEEHENFVDITLARDSERAVKELKKHMMITVDALRDADFDSVAQ